MAKARFNVVPLHYSDRGTELREVVVSRWLVGVAVIVLLIAITNVANLLLARAVRRRGEVGVRLALGAGRRRLVRLFLTEGIVLALLGALAALVVASGIAALVRGSLLADVEWTTSPVSGRVLVLSLGAALVTGALVGLLPALHASRVSVMQAIQRGSASGRRLSSASWPTVLQAALAAILVVGAGLFTRSLDRARDVPLGFDSDRVLFGEVQWSTPGDDDVPRVAAREQRAASWRRALERVQQLATVERAALAVGTPFGYAFGVPITVAGWDSLPKLAGGGPYVSAVTSDYFATVGTRLLRGRSFTSTEGAGTEPVALVNETMASTLWPGRDAIGQCIRIGADSAPCAQVVGIVENARRYELREPPSMQYYIPLGQERGFGGTVLLARPLGTPAEAAPAVKAAIESGDALIERADAFPMQERIDPLLRSWRLGATLFSLGGGLALAVAVLGLYSVMSYSVAQRHHELGVRMALGATSERIVRMVMQRGLLMAGAGVAAGIVVAIFAGRLVEDMLFETTSRDPVVLGTAVVVLLAAAALASLLPALRARRVDPIRALRSD
jgi:predicted permease